MGFSGSDRVDFKMDDGDNADRASQEIKALLKRLDPNKGSHKDRIRRLNKFRNFVTGVSYNIAFVVF